MFCYVSRKTFNYEIKKKKVLVALVYN